MSPTAVHSMLIRARQTVAVAAPGPDPRRASAGADSDHRELVARYVDAFERYDITALVTLLRDDATFSMPPHRLWLRGRDDIGRWLVDHACLGMRVLETRANGRPAVGIYHPDPNGTPCAFGIQVIELSGDAISALHVFIDRRLFPRFGLPAELAPV